MRLAAHPQAFVILLPIMVAIVMVGAPTFAGGPPSFQGVGDLPGGIFESRASDVSADGSVVVGWSVVTCPAPPQTLCKPEAFRWENGSLTGLGFLPSLYSPPFSGAKGVSADGSVVAGDGSSLQGTNEPFRWENGVMVGLGRIPGAWQNAHLTTGVSDDGRRIVGWGYNTAGNRIQAWMWEHGTMVGLGSLQAPPAHTFSFALGISGDGNVVVGLSDGAQGFRWTNGVMSGLGYLRSSPFPTPYGDVQPFSVANAASFVGNVIVGTSRSDSSGPFASEAFRWAGNTMMGLGDLAGGAFNSDAKAVSSNGSIIVGSGTTDMGSAAFIWDSALGMQDLRDVLVGSYGLDLTGWTLTGASGISSDGLVIVGNGINPTGQNEGWVARIPEPATAIMVALGGFFLARRRTVRSTVG